MSTQVNYEYLHRTTKNDAIKEFLFCFCEDKATGYNFIPLLKGVIKYIPWMKNKYFRRVTNHNMRAIDVFNIVKDQPYKLIYPFRSEPLDSAVIILTSNRRRAYFKVKIDDINNLDEILDKVRAEQDFNVTLWGDNLLPSARPKPV